MLLDILWYVPRTEPLSSLPVIRLRDAVRQQLQAMQQLLVQRGSVSDVRALHFRPPGLGLHCTIVYPLPATSGQVRLGGKLLVCWRGCYRLLLSIELNFRVSALAVS